MSRPGGGLELVPDRGTGPRRRLELVPDGGTGVVAGSAEGARKARTEESAGDLAGQGGRGA